MEIYGNTDIKQTKFKNLKNGDVFYFINDVKTHPEPTTIYMKVFTKENDQLAANVQTGKILFFDGDLFVNLLNASLHIE